MELQTINPELIETYKLLVWFLFGTTAILLSVVGYFLVREINQKDQSLKRYDAKFIAFTEAQEKRWKAFVDDQKERFDKLEGVINYVNTAVQNIDKLVTVREHLQAEHDPRVEKKLNEHDRQLISHGEELVYIKARLRKTENNH